MNILLVNPKIPDTFWSFRNAIKFISKKSSEPPLGLLTIAAMLPADWGKRLIDMNVETLLDKHLLWADYVFLTGMHIQKQSFMQVLERCNEKDIPVVAGGSMCSMEPELFIGISHLVINESEETLPVLIEDLKMGRPKPRYESSAFPEITATPVPLWELLNMKLYANMSIQYSRGCPYNCDFCSITLLNGRTPRCKSAEQFIGELDSLYQAGWRGRVFIVDDNFIGNKRKLKNEVLPALISWSEQHAYPFNFMTEVSINLSDDDHLLNLMVRAGFDAAFVGIETPDSASLEECGKTQNQNRDLVSAVKKMQNKGIIVSGGFIVGFDNDSHKIFDQQISFIQKSGIVTAMVGLLNAQPGTNLFKRMKAEKRLNADFSGDNMDGSINFIPKMNYDHLMAGYRRILDSIYTHKAYYTRVLTFLKNYRLPEVSKFSISMTQLKALFRSLWVLGIVERGRRYFWRFVLYTLFRYPRKFALAITMAIYGFHFRKVAQSA